MAATGAPFVVARPLGKLERFSAGVDRLRLLAVIVGLLLLVAGFGLAAWAIRQDYSLRVAGLWTGVTGTPHGITQHRWYEDMAGYGARCIQISTIGLGVALGLPRWAEGALFRWLGWLWLLIAPLSAAGAALAGLGISFHARYTFDVRRGLDVPMAPVAWRDHYFGSLVMAAALVGAVLAGCLGARWVFWAFASIVRGGRAKP